MAEPIPTRLSVIVLSLVRRLRASLSLSEAQVLVDARDDSEADELPTIAPQYVRIRRTRCQPIAESVDGLGRVYPRCLATLQVWLWTRLALDRPQEDLLWLTRSSIGHLDGEHELWDALLCWQPIDELQNWLVSEPIKPRNATAPKKSRKQKEWGRAGLEFDVTFMMALDQAYQ